MRRFYMAATLLAAPVFAGAQAPSTGTGDQTVIAEVSVLNLMAADQFAAAGLSKLSPAELRALSAWVRAHSLAVANLARAAALNPEPAASDNPGLIETRMAGDFTGWDGSTVFQFTNGQLWRQASFGTLHQFARSPRVTLAATSGGWRLQVDGVPQSIYVRRLR